MSGDNLRTPSKRQMDPQRDSYPSVTPRLLQRVCETGRDGTPQDIMAAITDGLPDHDCPSSEPVVTGSLDEILLALVALRDDDTHGTGLMEDIDRLFDVQPSPGTLYPRLHDLDESGHLSRHDLVQTKQYSIADEDRAADLIERAMYQHLSVGLFLRAALDAVETR